MSDRGRSRCGPFDGLVDCASQRVGAVHIEKLIERAGLGGEWLVSVRESDKELATRGTAFGDDFDPGMPLARFGSTGRRRDVGLR